MRTQAFFGSVFMLCLLLIISSEVWAVSGPQYSKTNEVVKAEAKVPVANYANSNRVNQSEKSVFSKVKNFAKRSVAQVFKPSRPKRPKDPGEGQAIASLILGILGILVSSFVPFSILAIILGSIAKRKYREGYHDRWGMAKAGVILGIVGLGLVILFLGVSLLPFFLI